MPLNETRAPLVATWKLMLLFHHYTTLNLQHLRNSDPSRNTIILGNLSYPNVFFLLPYLGVNLLMLSVGQGLVRVSEFGSSNSRQRRLFPVPLFLSSLNIGLPSNQYHSINQLLELTFRLTGLLSFKAIASEASKVLLMLNLPQ